MRVAKPVELRAEDERRLRILSKRKRVEVRVQLRARIVLKAAKGASRLEIAAALGVDRRVARRWRERFLDAGVEGLLEDAPRPGRPRTARATVNEARVVRATLEHSHPGRAPWRQRLCRGPHLARPWPEAASDRVVQALQRPALHRQARGYGVA